MPARDAVLFDLDSTLCVSEQRDHDVHEAVFERVDVEPFFSPADVRAVDPDDVPTATTDRGYYENLYRAVAADVGGDPSYAPELAEATVEVVDETAVRFREGAERALEYVRERYDVGLVTNGGETTQTGKLDRLEIADAFDATVFCDPRNGTPPKPDPTPFRQALTALDVGPERAVYGRRSRVGELPRPRRRGGRTRGHGLCLGPLRAPTRVPPDRARARTDLPA